MSASVLGDLCREADWIRCRLRVLRRDSSRCSSPNLERRFALEIKALADRCREMRLIASMVGSAGASNRIQLSLLKEIIERALLRTTASNVSTR